MKAPISSRVSSNFAALAASALLVAGCGTEEVELPLQAPEGFVEVSKEEALDLAEGLSACFVKNGVRDVRIPEPFPSYGGVNINKERLSLEDSLSLSAFGIDTYRDKGADCRGLAQKVISFNAKQEMKDSPGYVLTPDGRVALLLVDRKILTPKSFKDEAKAKGSCPE
jgi:hypothetical protein